jgi:hypothetical protein
VNWTARESGRVWEGVSISSTGLYQTAVVNSFTGKIYTSSDYGVNWTPRESERNWTAVSVSATGLYQTATATSGSGFILTSSDYGVNWTRRMTDMARSWKSVSVSATGLYQTAVIESGNIYTSNNYGVNWTARESSRGWRGVSISSDGLYQVATVYSGLIYTSTNYGVNWSGRDISRNWNAVSISATGLYQTAPIYNGLIYTSTATVVVTSFTFNLDTGTTFFLTGDAPTANYSANFTITVLDTTRCYYITLINNTSSVATRYCNAVFINGTSIPRLRFLYNVLPASLVLTGAVVTNQEFILFYNTTASAWFALTTVKVLQTA